jgi:hypothetical protein
LEWRGNDYPSGQIAYTSETQLIGSRHCGSISSAPVWNMCPGAVNET